MTVAASTVYAEPNLGFNRDFELRRASKEVAPPPKEIHAGRNEEAPAPRMVRPKPADRVSLGIVVNICYTHELFIKLGCEAFVKSLKACGIKVKELNDLSLEDIKKSLTGLPPTTNVFISAHGTNVDAPSVGKKNRHHLAVPLGLGTAPEKLGFSGKLPSYKLLPIPLWRSYEMVWVPITVDSNVLSTKTLLTATDEAISKNGVSPSKYIGACHSGEACDGAHQCTGSACRADQRSQSMTDAGMQEDQQRALAYLLCFPAAFKRADTDSDGVLSGEEVADYFKKAELPRQSIVLDEKGLPKRQTPDFTHYKLYPVTPDASSAAALQAGVGGGMGFSNFADIARKNKASAISDFDSTLPK